MSIRRWRHRIDQGDVIESPQGEFILFEDHETVIRRQASAAIAGMNAAKAISSGQLQQAYRLNRESSPESLESERSANSLLTEENERLRNEIEQWKQAVSRMRGKASNCLALKPTSGMMRGTLEQIAGLQDTSTGNA
jgi:hypothetical protein